MQGSSPLTRGKHRRRRSHPAARRLIPAHAGKTSEMVCRPHCPSAHPRSRGENSVISDIRSSLPGSSPLTRGKRREHEGGF